MWINRTTEMIDHSEPHLGTLTEVEYIVETEEVVELVIDAIRDTHEIPEVVYGICTVTDESMEIIVSEYL